ncbi:predicted protein [Histoplasma capsulatum G186AR]|uniref:Uncharacterized protein n=1 Tax=Ajellomyces capsulatus (strain G186AR / H82 / ATCC MYA-2454 / RMSCC 2432) TaxID=447093 RepID=C0P0W3_AJECG|nr:uncharacterized protein HCBG_09043 [Histoplasma capsulatum G186AR]EEH02763.1 predicted protein [Histoplasma capsulatum G186AR]
MLDAVPSVPFPFSPGIRRTIEHLVRGKWLQHRLVKKMVNSVAAVGSILRNQRHIRKIKCDSKKKKASSNIMGQLSFSDALREKCREVQTVGIQSRRRGLDLFTFRKLLSGYSGSFAN